MNPIFSIACALCVIAIAKIVSMAYYDYVARKKLKDVPCIESYPIIGSAFDLMKKSTYERMRWYTSLVYQYKDGIFVQWIGSMAAVHIFKPEFLEIILPSTVNIVKGKPYDLIRPWLGNGLLTSAGAQWFHDRKLIGPAFHFNILEQFAVIMTEKAEILTKCLEREIGKNAGEAIDIFPFATNVALDVICETAMGVNILAQQENTKYTTTVQRTSLLTMQRLFRPWYWVDWLYYSMPVGREYKSLLGVLHGFTKQVIRKKQFMRRTQKQGAAKNEEDADGDADSHVDTGKRKQRVFLDLLLDLNEKDEKPLTDDELRAQVDTFMFEGHDTTAAAITWALFCLGNNLEHQQKVHEELEGVFEDSDKAADVKELAELRYLDRVIKESMRLFPSVPMVSRRLKEEVTFGNYTIPKTSTVTLSIILTHRNPEVWPNPLKFDPDRFLPENCKNRNPYAYIPFSAGPRNCIGQRLAQLEEKIILTSILRKWRVRSLETMDAVKYEGSLILRPSEKILLRFTAKK